MLGATAALAALSMGAVIGACGSDGGSEFPGDGLDGGDAGDGNDASCGDTLRDPNNCGACGQTCAGGQCCDGVCVETAACTFAVTTVAPTRGFQNGGEWITLSGSGFAKGMRVYFGTGRAPTQVIDGTRARVQTPPGLPGDVDVRIELAGTSATRKRAFTYDSAGVLPPWKSIPMANVRGEDPGLTVLQDGRVLIAGGTTVPDSVVDSQSSIELFVRDQEKVVPAAGSMAIKRWQNNAITLIDGRVLLVGGACADDGGGCQGDASIAELFDPTTGAITPTTAKMNMLRAYPRSVLLPDGRVLVSSANDPSLEVFDPASGTFALVANTDLHVFGFMVRLRDGRVLFGAGDGGKKTAQIFDPDTNQVTSTGALAEGRSMLTAHTLPDGRVAVVGGASLSAGGITVPLDSIELYDPASGTFSTAPYKLSIGRTWQAAALVRDGTLMVMGGYTIDKDCSGSTGTVDRIDPILGTVTPFAALPDAKRSTEWTAVTLLDGSIVAVGGGACGTTKALPEVYFLPGAPGPK
jgi:hypothetical protein